jgi:hypothetical protein
MPTNEVGLQEPGTEAPHPLITYYRYLVSAVLDGDPSKRQNWLEQLDPFPAPTPSRERYASIARGEVVDAQDSANPYRATFRVHHHKSFECQVSSVGEGRARPNADLSFLREKFVENQTRGTPVYHLPRSARSNRVSSIFSARTGTWQTRSGCYDGR